MKSLIFYTLFYNQPACCLLAFGICGTPSFLTRYALVHRLAMFQTAQYLYIYDFTALQIPILAPSLVPLTLVPSGVNIFAFKTLL